MFVNYSMVLIFALTVTQAFVTPKDGSHCKDGSEKQAAKTDGTISDSLATTVDKKQAFGALNCSGLYDHAD